MSEINLVLERTCDSCPTQYEGSIDGYPLYFRMRWGGWRFTVAEKEIALHRDARGIRGFNREDDLGEENRMLSYMADDEAMQIIEDCLIEFIESGFDRLVM